MHCGISSLSVKPDLHIGDERGRAAEVREHHPGRYHNQPASSGAIVGERGGG